MLWWTGQLLWFIIVCLFDTFLLYICDNISSTLWYGLYVFLYPCKNRCSFFCWFHCSKKCDYSFVGYFIIQFCKNGVCYSSIALVLWNIGFSCIQLICETIVLRSLVVIKVVNMRKKVHTWRRSKEFQIDVSQPKGLCYFL